MIDSLDKPFGSMFSLDLLKTLRDPPYSRFVVSSSPQSTFSIYFQVGPSPKRMSGATAEDIVHQGLAIEILMKIAQMEILVMKVQMLVMMTKIFVTNIIT